MMSPYKKLLLTFIFTLIGLSSAFSAQAATQIFRSVGPGATGALASDGSHASTVTVASGTATFSVGLREDIGVGDAVIIDTGGTDQAIDASDTLLFIHSRTSSTSYTLRTHTGATPSDISINDTYQIYRAYTSLANSEAGTKNTSIPIAFNGGNRDLVTNDEQWNIACYANGTTADTTAVDIFGWTTDVDNFIKIYTPTLLTEVGVSQRHNGGDNSGYKLNGISGVVINMRVGYTVIDGLEIANWSSGDGIAGNYGGDVIGYKTISNMLIHDGGGSGINAGIYFTYSKIYNNLIYNCSGDGINIPGGGEGSFVYNNTVYNSTLRGIYSFAYITQLKNNIVQDNGVSDFSGNFDGNDDYNISADTTAPGTNSKINTTVSFVSTTPGAEDFHLAQSDTAARGAGANLTADANLPFSTDIDGQLRNPSGAGWDIGADEGTKEFVATVMQTGGNFSTLSSWEDAIDSDLVADTTRVFSHGGITGTIVGGNTVTGLTSGATATVVYATSTQILLHTVSGIFQAGETVQVSAGNSVVISDNGNPASAVAKIDGAWSTADTTAVAVDGWATGHDNYIKIYTTSAARHSGKWDDGKYILSNSGNALFGNEKYLRIEGLQFAITGHYNRAVKIFGDYNYFYKNIIKVLQTSSFGLYTYSDFLEIYNNIVYGGDVCYYLSYDISRTRLSLFNNTAYGPNVGFYNVFNSNTIAKNNISSNHSLNYGGLYSSLSSNNISSDATAPGTNSKTNTAVSFVSTTPGAEDFHLASDDTAAKDAGTDLSTYLSTDIDGQTRPAQSVFDIGADEAPTRIYRSVGPSKTDTLDDDAGHTKNVTLTAGVATFSAPLPDNVGVGDVLIIDTAGTADTIDSADTLLFIQKRNSSTSYQLQTHAGAMSANITSNDTYQIYRAHTSLANAESGTINATLSGLGFTFNGGNRDLVANNEQWNIACYANGTTADTTAVTVDGWTTGPYNFLKVYTPVLATEVGESQRHKGKWDEGKYKVVGSFAYYHVVGIADNYIRLQGIQVQNTSSSSSAVRFLEGGGYLILSDSIIKGNSLSASSSNMGIRIIYSGQYSIINNIFYDFEDNVTFNSSGIYIPVGGNVNIYNNTFFDCNFGVWGNNTDLVMLAKNNIVKSSSTGYRNNSGSYFSEYSSNNISSDDTAPGTNSKINTIVKFVNESADDFHLASTDTSAKNMGLNLSADLNLPFDTDIDGQSRPTGPDWDIGADEITDAESVRMKGDVKMKGDVRMR